MPVEFKSISIRYVNINGMMTGHAQPHADYNAMAAKWLLVDDLLGGTETMRARGETWLPREPEETPLQYSNRLKRTFLYGAFADSIERVVEKPFSQAVTISETNDFIDQFVKNIDLQGSDLTTVCCQTFEQLVAYGKCHIYVDFPSGVADNLEEDRGRRAFVRIIDVHDLINWKSEIIDGVEKLTQIRFIYNHTNEVGVETIFLKEVNDDGSWQTWVLDKDKWIPQDQGVHSFNGIPLVTVYTKRKKFMVAEPPLYPLAELCLCHYQSFSDQRSALRFARIGMIGATGLSPEEMEKGVTVGPNRMLKSANPNAKFFYVEASGSAISIGEQDLTHLEERMEVLGLQPLIQRTATSTATGKAIDESRNETTAQRWIRLLETGWTEVLKLAGKWKGDAIPEKTQVNIFNDFGISANSTDKDFLLKCRVAGEITRLTFLKEIKRRNVLSDEVDPEQEAKDAEAEASAMGLFPVDPSLAPDASGAGNPTQGTPPAGAPPKAPKAPVGPKGNTGGAP